MSIVRCLFSHLVDRCEERGYDIHNVMPCIMRIDGDYIHVDTEHMAYPEAKKTPEEIAARAKKVQEYYDNLNQQLAEQSRANEERLRNAKPPANFGPGTELKKMLAKIGITATPTCSCNSRAAIMDEKGVQWCKDNTDTIVSWLREEATKRGLPFVDLAGKIIVKRAISLAEKAEKKRQQAEEQNKATDG